MPNLEISHLEEEKTKTKYLEYNTTQQKNI